MKLHELKPAEGSRKVRNRVGRGTSSGNGKTSGRGQKGQKARSGGGVRLGFEGGQMPLYRRLAKKGFSNYPFSKEYAVINLSLLEGKFVDGEIVDNASLHERGLLKKLGSMVKILGNGELTKKLSFNVSAVSASAKAKIEKMGGSVNLSQV